jgi:hypothetical protein
LVDAVVSHWPMFASVRLDQTKVVAASVHL